MRVLNKKEGDIYINPVMGDLWILKKIYNGEKEEWVLDLVHEDYYESLSCVKGFKKVGNIYDLVFKELAKENAKGDKKKCK